MDDLISRQAVLDMLEDINNHIIDGYGYRHDWCVEWVKGLPSIDIEDIIVSHEEIGYERGLRDGYAQAVTESEATEQWIPCSERLPEESGRYLVTRGLNACGSLWNRIYIANYSDLMGIKSKRIWWKGNVGKSDFERLDDVLAWMPLPKPYEAERKEE